MTTRDIVGEHMVPLEKALHRYGRGYMGRWPRTQVTFAAVRARLYKQKYSKWFVAVARRFSGNVNHRSFRALVDGPFEMKKHAALRAREYRRGICETHDDCRSCTELGVACWKAVHEKAEER